MEIIKEQYAEDAINAKNKIATYKFCPLKNGNCIIDCVSFKSARYIEIDGKKKEGRIAYGCCDSPILIRISD